MSITAEESARRDAEAARQADEYRTMNDAANWKDLPVDFLAALNEVAMSTNVASALEDRDVEQALYAIKLALREALGSPVRNANESLVVGALVQRLGGRVEVSMAELVKLKRCTIIVHEELNRLIIYIPATKLSDVAMPDVDLTTIGKHYYDLRKVGEERHAWVEATKALVLSHHEGHITTYELEQRLEDLNMTRQKPKIETTFNPCQCHGEDPCPESERLAFEAKCDAQADIGQARVRGGEFR